METKDLRRYGGASRMIGKKETSLNEKKMWDAAEKHIKETSLSKEMTEQEAIDTICKLGEMEKETNLSGKIPKCDIIDKEGHESLSIEDCATFVCDIREAVLRLLKDYRVNTNGECIIAFREILGDKLT